jgi:hypothetical protein
MSAPAEEMEQLPLFRASDSAPKQTVALPAQPIAQAAPAGAEVLISKEQRRRLYEIIIEIGWSQDQVRDLLSKHFGVDNTAKVPAARFDAACKLFERQCVQEPLARAELIGEPAADEGAREYHATDEDLPAFFFGEIEATDGWRAPSEGSKNLDSAEAVSD